MIHLGELLISGPRTGRAANPATTGNTPGRVFWTIENVASSCMLDKAAELLLLNLAHLSASRLTAHQLP